jgi:hypothetical protein
MTKWHLAYGTDVEILKWLDDHYRYLLSCTACPPLRRFRLRRVFADRRLGPTFPIDRRA